MTRMALEQLARSLEEQQCALRQLRFKFEVQEVVLSGGRHQWLSETTAELDRALQAVQEGDRAVRSSLRQAAVAVGLSPESTVRELAAQAPEPWGYIFEQHRTELRTSIDQVAALSRANRTLLARGHAATVAALEFLGATFPGSYDESGTLSPVSGSVGLLDARA